LAISNVIGSAICSEMRTLVHNSTNLYTRQKLYTNDNILPRTCESVPVEVAVQKALQRYMVPNLYKTMRKESE
jgi:hypothetical protein